MPKEPAHDPAYGCAPDTRTVRVDHTTWRDCH